MADLYVALLHHPVYGRERAIVTSSVTNIDVHDIARSCVTYGVAGFYVVTPVDAHRALVRRILRHWEQGRQRAYNPTRNEALDAVRRERTLEGAIIDIERSTGRVPELVATTAKHTENAVGYAEGARRIERSETPQLLLFGTSWGLVDETLAECRMVLEPIEGPTDYNHLSVRAAAAIVLDRLRGKR